MKIVQINTTCGLGSTGKISLSISKILNDNGIENYILYSSGRSDYDQGIRYMTNREVKAGTLESRICGNLGFESTFATRKLIKILDEIKPDIVHIHNIHSHNCNIDTLFDYLKNKKIHVIWTFHDCWAFTGYCTYFSFIGCDKWKTQCSKCPEVRKYSWFSDSSEHLYESKKRILSDIDMTIVTPSSWLAGLVKESFLKSCNIEVINNGIDTEIFRPIQSEFRTEYGISDADHIILGVSFEWGHRKGLDVFVNLADRLPENYKIVLVGTNDNIDKKLPSNIISIHRTHNQQELAKIYSVADVFVNPTREDNFPTVNMEALACGTPVITFNTGGSPELLDDTCGVVVRQGDIEGLSEAILNNVGTGTFTAEMCLKRSQRYEQKECFSKYLDLYKRYET